MQNPAITKKRIDILDALRGFALFGIILAHMNNQYYAGMNPPGHETMNIKNAADGVLQLLSDIFISGKFFTIFSFLFGLSFGIQLLNAKAKGEPFLGRFAWRLVVLFIIGIINHIHYRGDILTIYAVLGFFLLLFHKLSNKALLIWSFFFILNMPAFIFRTVGYIGSLNKPATGQVQNNGAPEGFDMKKFQAEATLYFNMVKKGDYTGLMKENITKEFRNKLFFQIFSGRLFVTMGLFLLGLYMSRRGIFENIQQYSKGIKKWFWVSLILCFICIGLYASMGDKLFQAKGLPGLLFSFLGDTFNPALTMVYVGAFILLFQKQWWQNKLSVLAPMGRMGLTSYLTQTIIGVIIFYGYGLNLMDAIGNSTAMAIGVVFFVLQLYFSKWWMAHYHYGPLEWIWRSLTYFKVQPWKK